MENSPSLPLLLKGLRQCLSLTQDSQSESLRAGKNLKLLTKELDGDTYKTTTTYQSRCLGPSWPLAEEDFQKGMVMNAFQCRGGPCGGSNGTCLRYVLRWESGS